MLDAFNLFLSQYPTMFSQLNKFTPEQKAQFMSRLFGGKQYITNSDINLLRCLLKNINVFNTVFSYIETYRMLSSYPSVNIPIYLDIFNKDNIRQKEYVEVTTECRNDLEHEISVKCIVVPVYPGMNNCKLFNDIKILILDCRMSSHGTFDTSTFWESLFDTFWPVFSKPMVDCDERLLIPTDTPREKDFSLEIGRYNLTENGYMVYIGSSIYIETMFDNQLYLYKSKLNLNDENYQQQLMSLFYSNQMPSSDSGNLLLLDRYYSKKAEKIKNYLS